MVLKQLISYLEMLTTFQKMTNDITSLIEKREVHIEVIKRILCEGIRLRNFKELIVPKLITFRLLNLKIVESIVEWRVMNI